MAVAAGNNDDQQQKQDPALFDDLKQKCTEWVNFSAFYARLLASGVMDRYSDPCRYANADIPKGLEETKTDLDLSNDVKRSCKVLVSANWLWIAGDVLHRRYLQQSTMYKPEECWGLNRWPIWTEKLRDISTKEDCSSELRDIAGKAYTQMVHGKDHVS